MKKLLIFPLLFTLYACGTIGIGSNHKTMIYNNSTDIINVTSDNGIYKIHPDSNLEIYSSNNITITNLNTACPQPIIYRKPNIAAMTLDVFPGFIFGILPLLVDAVSNNLYRQPHTYYYSCTE